MNVWEKYGMNLMKYVYGNYDGHPKYTNSFSSFTLEKNHPFNITERLTSEGIDFIERNRKKPFLLWINYQDPHPAYCCPEPYSSMYNPEEIKLSAAVTDYNPAKQPVRNTTFRAHSEMDLCDDDCLKKSIAHYMGQITYVDDNVGRLFNKLKELNLETETIILFFSDHGELLGDYGMTHKNPTFYECLSSIPAILVHPSGEWKGISYTGLVEEVDMTPTLLDLLGLEIPKTMVGKSLVPSMKNKTFEGKESVLCEAGGGAPTCKTVMEGYRQTAPHAPTSFGPGAMIRWKDFKLSVYADDNAELYNLASDPLELNNLYDDPSILNYRRI